MLAEADEPVRVHHREPLCPLRVSGSTTARRLGTCDLGYSAL